MSDSIQITHSEEFSDFVKNGINQKYYVGIGNPNAKILYVGKEAAIGKDDPNIHHYSNNADRWSKYIENNSCEVLSYPVQMEHDLRKGWGRNTWSKYQKLTDNIFEKQSAPFYVDFLEKVFTTEINDAPEKRSVLASKISLNQRKELFRNSEFIQSFPVVVLACSDYVKNNSDIREIDMIFDVEYTGDEIGKYDQYSKGNWFYLHYNSDRTKLVIHTRQLSSNVDDKLLEDMGRVIRQHLAGLAC